MRRRKKKKVRKDVQIKEARKPGKRGNEGSRGDGCLSARLGTCPRPGEQRQRCCRFEEGQYP